MDMDTGSTQGIDGTGGALPASITLTTDGVTGDAASLLVDALHASGVAVARHAFLPPRVQAHKLGRERVKRLCYVE